jgi:hypothetical protein
MNMVTFPRLQELLDYDPVTGAFIWKPRKDPHWNGKWAGTRAGTITRGYRQISIDYRLHRASRLAWFYMTGQWPKLFIDHINTDRGDDRFANLREATHAQNARNSRRPRTNTSGFKGVCFDKHTGRWRAGIYLDNKKINIGRFESAAEAHAAYAKFAELLHQEFARLK